MTEALHLTRIPRTGATSTVASATSPQNLTGVAGLRPGTYRITVWGGTSGSVCHVGRGTVTTSDWALAPGQTELFDVDKDDASAQLVAIKHASGDSSYVVQITPVSPAAQVVSP